MLYSNRFTDDELVAVSRREDRLLLSRDTRLLVRKVVDRFVFLESEDIQAQIRQIFRVTGTSSLPGLLTRCLSCNNLLAEAPRESVRGCVPPFVFETQNRFKQCPTCAASRFTILILLAFLLQGMPSFAAAGSVVSVHYAKPKRGRFERLLKLG